MKISHDTAKCIQDIQRTANETMTKVTFKVSETVDRVSQDWEVRVEPMKLEITTNA